MSNFSIANILGAHLPFSACMPPFMPPASMPPIFSQSIMQATVPTTSSSLNQSSHSAFSSVGQMDNFPANFPIPPSLPGAPAGFNPFFG